MGYCHMKGFDATNKYNLTAIACCCALLISCGNDKAQQASTPPKEPATTAVTETKTTESQTTTAEKEDIRKETTSSTTDTTTETTASNKPAGLELAKKSGCLACHAVDHKLVGPAWKDVAARYKGDANARDTLVAKVKKGGKGNWIEVTGGAMMPPYSPRVSDENVAALIEFILALE